MIPEIGQFALACAHGTALKAPLDGKDVFRQRAAAKGADTLVGNPALGIDHENLGQALDAAIDGYCPLRSAANRV